MMSISRLVAGCPGLNSSSCRRPSEKEDISVLVISAVPGRVATDPNSRHSVTMSKWLGLTGDASFDVICIGAQSGSSSAHAGFGMFCITDLLHLQHDTDRSFHQLVQASRSAYFRPRGFMKIWLMYYRLMWLIINDG